MDRLCVSVASERKQMKRKKTERDSLFIFIFMLALHFNVFFFQSATRRRLFFSFSFLFWFGFGFLLNSINFFLAMQQTHSTRIRTREYWPTKKREQKKCKESYKYIYIVMFEYNKDDVLDIINSGPWARILPNTTS